jgi:RimJ/RimL family protein N-acetyltransferase
MTFLRGEKALLRPMRRSDIDCQREFFNDAELAWLNSTSPGAYAEIDADALFQSSAQDVLEAVHFAIEVNQEYVGFCSLMNLANSNNTYELGITIVERRCWNRGLGKEVVALLLEHGFGELGAQTIELTTNARNDRAIGCFSARGFTEHNRVKSAILIAGEWVDMIEMSIDLKTWRSLSSI